MPKPSNFAIVNIGDELLNGTRVNSHLTLLGEKINLHGGRITHATAIPDTEDAIAAAIRTAADAADIVITTGGLGPTVDDRTREALCHVLGEKSIEDPEVIAAIEDRFIAMGRPMSPNNRRQAQRPPSSLVLRNDWGTAPGLFTELDHCAILNLPGPTQELEPMFEHRVVPLLRDLGIFNRSVESIQLRTCGAGESQVETRLQNLIESYPAINFAFCAHNGIVDVRLNRLDPSIEPDALMNLADKARTLLGEDFFAYGATDLAGVLVQQMRCWERSLAIAESCTGGLCASAFTDIPGASKVFKGGLVCYTNESKIEILGVPEPILQQHGAVSAECAVAMATSASERFGADYSLAVTGFAGPGGGTAHNPVGTIYVATASPSGVWSKRLYHAAPRASVKQRAVNEALDLLRRNIHKHRFADLLAGSSTDTADQTEVLATIESYGII